MTAADIRRTAALVLTPKQYDAWKLVEWEGISRRQAARLLGISRQTLNDRLQAATPKVVRACREDQHHGRQKRRRSQNPEPVPEDRTRPRASSQSAAGRAGSKRRRRTDTLAEAA